MQVNLSVPAELPFAECITFNDTSNVRGLRFMSARFDQSAAQSPGLATTKKRIRLIESNEPQHRVLLRLLDDFHVTGMIVEPEQRHALREKLSR